MPDSEFHRKLKWKIHKFIMHVYDITENFPKSELYGATSQLRRAAVSIMLNYVEGYARFKPKVKLNSFETSFGSAKESKYLIFLALKRGWTIQEQYDYGFKLIDEILAMLWSIIDGMQENN